MNKINISQLPNKLNLISCKDEKYLSVAICFLVKINKYESWDNAGISHFLEHMLFKGTKTKNHKMLAHEIDTLGGEFNAYTSKEHICIYSTVMKKNIYNAIDIILDIISNSAFEESEIDKERSVILQEIDNNYDNLEEYVFDNLFFSAYQSQYLGHNLLGCKKFIKNITKSRLQNYFRLIFQPHNMCFAFVGNVEHLDIQLYIENHQYLPIFNNIPHIPNSKNLTESSDVKFFHNNVIYQVRDIVQSYFVIGFQAYKYTNIRVNYVLHILSVILGDGFSSRLFQKFREDLAIVYNIGTNINSYENSGVFNIYGACNITDLNVLLVNLYEEILNIMKNITSDELSRSKTLITTNLVISQENSASLVNSIIYDFVLLNKIYNLHELFNIIHSITKQEVLDIANEIFSKQPAYSIISGKKIDIPLYNV